MGSLRLLLNVTVIYPSACLTYNHQVGAAGAVEEEPGGEAHQQAGAAAQQVVHLRGCKLHRSMQSGLPVLQCTLL